ncbi:MAG: hypothetical protein LBQ30_00045 [Treponema sp.]|nr:hypothetical protein [Treponema sp.]
MVTGLDVTEKTTAERNAEYWAKLEESRKQYAEGKYYTFAMEDLDAFADGLLDKTNSLLGGKISELSFSAKAWQEYTDWQFEG